MKELHPDIEPGISFQNPAQKDLLDFIYTSQLLKVVIPGIPEDNSILLTSEVERQIFPYRTYSARKNIQYMTKNGLISATKKTSGESTQLYLKALRPGVFRPELMKPESTSLNHVHKKMRETLKHVGVLPGTNTTIYCNQFLQHKESYSHLFFAVDNFSGKVHTPFTSMLPYTRKNILIDSAPTKCISVSSIQALTLSLVLQAEKGRNSFTSMVNSGIDIYQKVSDVLKLSSREKGKEKFIGSLLAPPNNDLFEIFGASSWINWLNSFKRKKVKHNRYCSKVRNSNVLWAMQSKEVEVMQRVWKRLTESNILFLSVNDEIIVKESDVSQALELYKDTFDYYFPCYTINIK